MQHPACSPHWKNYMNSKKVVKISSKNKENICNPRDAIPQTARIESNCYQNECEMNGNLLAKQGKMKFHKIEPKKGTHKRKASANIPYQFPNTVGQFSSNGPLDSSRLMQKAQSTLSKVQCCPELPGDIDEVMMEGPSPPKKKQNKTPPSQETNETSHVTSHKKRGTENSMQSEDSIGFLECSESLGNDKSSSSSGMEGISSMPQGKDSPPKPQSQISTLNANDQDRVLDTEMNAVLNLDTLNYLVDRELKYKPDPYYMEKKQPQLTWKMRTILLDWMMEVCAEFNLKRETFHYAVNYVDRYLTISPAIDKSTLQLIGVSSMFIAAKVEEIYPPTATQFAKSTDDGYNIKQVLEMEGKIMTVFLLL
jgi:hypothetical protein